MLAIYAMEIAESLVVRENRLAGGGDVYLS